MPNYVRFQHADGRIGAGILEGDRIAIIEQPFWETTRTIGRFVATPSVKLLAPTTPRSIVCVGLNYSSHLNGRPVPDPPTLFFKPLSSLAGPGDPIRLPEGAGRVDPEGEIVIVVGSMLRNATRDEALAGIFGYTAGNDVSAREWQAKDGQWWRAKGSDTFGIVGPTIVTGLKHDELEVVLRKNGEEFQRGHSTELIRDIPEILRLVSSVMTLVPGDLVYTGTPGDPPPIVSGDVVEVEVTGAGILQNPVA